jgi:sugar/nucleoside kinase (ribokinase family)
LSHRAPDARFIEVPVANNRVTLRYAESERRCERMAGGVPGWKWPELGPMVADLDAVYVNFISGFEMCLGTADALRQGFRGPIYADLHSLFLGTAPDGIRVLRPLANAGEWFCCFDTVQMNEDEMRQIGEDPMTVAAIALQSGVSLLNVTLGPRGVAYVEANDAGPVRTALISAPAVEALDPTGCGDVFGATCFARMLAGDSTEAALTAAVAAASRNATFRGATKLNDLLRGRLVVA